MANSVMVSATVESEISVATVGRKRNCFNKWLALQSMRRFRGLKEILLLRVQQIKSDSSRQTVQQHN
jgi:hypothetical protein